MAGCLSLFLLLAGGIVGLGYLFLKWRQAPQTPTPSTTSTTKSPTAGNARELNLLLGNPGNAKADTGSANSYLMVKSAYTLSYNRQRGISNWASWHVSTSDLGDSERANNFRPDDTLPANWPRVTPNDYTGSGYDRGHICPSADRTADDNSNSETFLMTNMMPQTADNNRGPWEKMEAFTRSLVKRGRDAFVIAGSYGNAKQLRGKVTVPTNTWKIVVVVPQGLRDASQINNSAQVIAINIPNVEGIKEDDWRKYRTTVRALEQATGYDLLSNLRPDVQKVLESRVDNQ